MPPAARKLIKSANLSGEPAAWQVPSVDSVESVLDPAAELEQLRQVAKQQGFDEGHRAGLAAAEQSIDAQTTALNTVLAALARPLENLDHEIEESLLDVVQVIATHVIRREIELDRKPLLTMIHSALEALPAATGNVRVRMHPADVAAFGEDGADKPANCEFESDASLEPGDCIVEAGHARIDGRLTTHIRRAIEQHNDA